MRQLRLMAIVGACIVSGPISARAQTEVRGGLDTVRFAPALGVDLTRSRLTSSGAYVRDVASGAGPEATRSSTATVRYRVARPDGTNVGADTANTFSFRIGAGVAMLGFDEGVRGMKVGAQRQLVVPRHAQGASEISGVPVGSPIVFSVQLVAVLDPKK